VLSADHFYWKEGLKDTLPHLTASKKALFILQRIYSKDFTVVNV
jgi:hypothetical protein